MEGTIYWCLSMLSHVMYILFDFLKIYHVQTFYLRIKLPTRGQVKKIKKKRIKLPMTTFITKSFVRLIDVLYRRKISIAKACIYLLGASVENGRKI